LYFIIIEGGVSLEQLVRRLEGLSQDAAKGVISDHGSPAEDDKENEQEEDDESSHIEDWPDVHELPRGYDS
jgi:hypothetical protein